MENPELKGLVLDAMNTAVYKRLREEQIEIPYAKQDLYIKGLPETIRAVASRQPEEPGSTG